MGRGDDGQVLRNSNNSCPQLLARNIPFSSFPTPNSYFFRRMHLYASVVFKSRALPFAQAEELKDLEKLHDEFRINIPRFSCRGIYGRSRFCKIRCRCHSGFCPPQKASPRTQSASGLCPGGYNPLADSVRGDTIRQRILSGETCSASGFCPSSAECVPPPPPTINPLPPLQLRMVKWSSNARIHINYIQEKVQSNNKSVSQSHTHRKSRLARGNRSILRPGVTEPFSEAMQG